MPDDNTELQLSAFGKTVSVKGIWGIIVVMMLVLTSFLGWLLYGLSTAATTAVKEAVAVQQQTALEHRAIMEGGQSIKDDYAKTDQLIKGVESSVKIQNYILLSDQEEKMRIKRKLQMPKELKELMNDR